MPVLRPWFLRLLLALLTCTFLGCDSGGGGGGSTILSPNDGARGGFLWKPRSESNGRLVVLLPNQYRQRVAGAAIHTDDSGSPESLVEQGVFAGDTHNGARPHFRFSQSGGSYGNNIFLVADTADGKLAYPIANGGSRWD